MYYHIILRCCYSPYTGMVSSAYAAYDYALYGHDAYICQGTISVEQQACNVHLRVDHNYC